ncbi:ribonuclease domain-containing protein, partial [Chryseobacterium taichungense]|uniref:ribonuclease domain-containing protein n=1 Tax=Chryseobacterium taichungense TaxID=295069 RepID=UPI0028AEF1E8
PGKAIGGDRFGNREKSLPEGMSYFEADVNYHCGNRNGDRIVFTENGDVYLTKDHYKSFKKQ